MNRTGEAVRKTTAMSGQDAKWGKENTIIDQQAFHWYIYHSGCLKGWPFLSFYFLPSICIYTCLSLGHCYKQIWCFTPLFSSVVLSVGFGLVIRMFLWWRGGRPFYALLLSGFVWMLLSLCTLISIVSGLRDSFPFSSFSGSFLRERKKHRGGCGVRSMYTFQKGNDENFKHTYNWCEQAKTWDVREHDPNNFLHTTCSFLLSSPPVITF